MTKLLLSLCVILTAVASPAAETQIGPVELSRLDGSRLTMQNYAEHRATVVLFLSSRVTAVNRFGGRAVMTSESHPSGTDRIAEAVANSDADVIVNIQGDEPMIDPVMLEEVVAPFRNGTDAGLVTLKKRVLHEEDYGDPNFVKVVTDPAGFALCFSRSLIPYPRKRTVHFKVFEHIGLYAYTRDCLLRLSRIPPSPLEEIECLEQLRALENGIRILVVETRCEAESVSVDTQTDLERVRRLLQGASHD
jgi:3-deoxy-manno-octulosonate cytidylyltransferase (CMP-KDO synthetase)